MAHGAILEALKEVRAEKSEVREALVQRAERLASEQKIQQKPGPLREAISAILKKG